MNYYVFHIHFILSIFLSNTFLIFDFICLTLSLADTHGIAKYARTYILRYTHKHTKTKSRNIRKKGKKKGGAQGKKKQKRKKNRETNVTIFPHCHIIFLGSAWKNFGLENLAWSWVLGAGFLDFFLGVLPPHSSPLARQLQQERTQVVCSNREAWKNPARGHSRNGPWTFFLSFFGFEDPT